MSDQADVEFFWDPVCPWAWLTSRWVDEVAREFGQWPAAAGRVNQGGGTARQGGLGVRHSGEA